MKIMKDTNLSRPLKLTLSDKYQLVIPKNERKKLGLTPGQQFTVKSVGARTITFERQPTMKELLERGKGTLVNAPWDKEGIDPADWLSRQRHLETEKINRLHNR